MKIDGGWISVAVLLALALYLLAMEGYVRYHGYIINSHKRKDKDGTGTTKKRAQH